MVDDAAGETEWSKPEDRKSDLWSSNFGASSPGDLSDFAAAALNFRSQLSDMVLEKGVDDKMEEEEDLMEKLLREQSELTAGDDSLGLEEDLPAWATSLSVTQESVHPVANVSSSNSASIGGITIDGSHMVSFLPSASLSQPIFSDLAPARSTSSALNNFSIIDGPISLIPDVRQNTIPEWFYLDPQGKIQGPFSQDNMRLWHEGGYFPRDLPIKLRTWSNFHPFIDVFEDLRLAFFSVPSEPRIRSTILALSSALNTPAQSIPLAPVQSQSDVQFMNSRVEESRGKLVKPNNPLDVSQEVELESWKPSRPAQPQPKEVPVEKAPQDTQSARAASSSQSFPVVHSVAKSDFAKQLLGIGAKPSPAPSSNDETPTNPTPAVAASNDSSAASSSAVHKDAPDSAQVQTRTSKVSFIIVKYRHNLVMMCALLRVG